MFTLPSRVAVLLLAFSLLALLPGAALAVQPGDVIFSEMLIRSSASSEWIELFNAGTETIDLSTYSIGSGGTDYTNSRTQLQGTIAPGACLVVGGPDSNDDNANPVIDLAIRFSPNLQNSGSTADGVALFNVPAAQIQADTVPIDAVIYGGANESALIDDEGNAPEPHVGDVSGGQSIARDQEGWGAQENPTPNDCSAFE